MFMLFAWYMCGVDINTNADIMRRTYVLIAVSGNRAINKYKLLNQF